MKTTSKTPSGTRVSFKKTSGNFTAWKEKTDTSLEDVIDGGN